MVRTAVRAGRGTRSKVANLCRDLGTLYPDCLTVKMFYRGAFVMSAPGTDYTRSIPMYPLLPCTSFGAVSGYTNGSATSALGFTRLVGTASPAFYKEALTVCVAYKINIMNVPHISTATGATTYNWNPWRHYLHFYDNDGAAQTAATTQALSDQFAMQPDVRTKVQSVQATMTNITAAGSNFLTGSRVVWKGVVWPHKVQEIPFSTYLGDKPNWGSSSAAPTQFAAIQIAGAAYNPDTASTQLTLTYFDVDLCYTMMLKTPIGNYSN